MSQRLGRNGGGVHPIVLATFLAIKICMSNVNCPIIVAFKFGIRFGRNALFEEILSGEKTSFAV